MIQYFLTTILIVTSAQSLAKNPSSNENLSPSMNSKTIESFDHNHTKWTVLLKNFLIRKDAISQFNYATLKETPQSLNEYLEILRDVTKKDFDTWNDKQKMSFWINAYNALTVKLIIDHYPIKSIKDIGGFFSSPWKKEFFKIFGKKFYLDKIEHEILRKKFNEPRIHFAVNCASIGCPALRDEAFTAKKLDSQLHEQAQLFLKDTLRNNVNHKTKTITVSKIFKWFKEDFGRKNEKIIEYVFPYMSTESDSLEVWKKYDLEYSDYDWKLNEVKN